MDRGIVSEENWAAMDLQSVAARNGRPDSKKRRNHGLPQSYFVGTPAVRRVPVLHYVPSDPAPHVHAVLCRGSCGADPLGGINLVASTPRKTVQREIMHFLLDLLQASLFAVSVGSLVVAVIMAWMRDPRAKFWWLIAFVSGVSWLALYIERSN